LSGRDDVITGVDIAIAIGTCGSFVVASSAFAYSAINSVKNKRIEQVELPRFDGHKLISHYPTRALQLPLRRSTSTYSCFNKRVLLPPVEPRQFRSRNFRAVLKANGLTGSMGRVAAAGDNAAMESFFSLLQKNVLDQRRGQSRSELHYEVVTWIERSYNRRRRQRSLGKLTPVQFELAFADLGDVAA
jgi:putative transposase